MGVGKTRKWERIMTYGPKLVENCIQAIARDILAEAMLRVDATGFDIVAHVHDEMIVEVPNRFLTDRHDEEQPRHFHCRG